MNPFARFARPWPLFEAAHDIGDAVRLGDGRLGVVIRRELDLTPAISAYHVLVHGVTVIAAPDTLHAAARA